VQVYLVPTIDGVAYGLLLFCAAAGLSLAFGVADVLNLAHGTLYAAGAYTAAALAGATVGGLVAATAVAIAVGGVGGAALAAATAPLAGRGHLPQVMLTLGAGYVGVDVLTTVFGADELPTAPPAVLDRSISVLGHAYPAYRLVFIGVGAVLAVGLHLVVYRSRAGAVVRACVDDRQMLACLGFHPFAVNAAVLAAAGGLAAGGGALGAPIIGAAPSTATTIMLLSLVVVVLGGPGNIRGALVACLAVGQVQTLGYAAAPTLAPFLLFAPMAAVLAWRARPAGHRRGLRAVLLGRPA
jgi:branched-chain amino acid transport system permease protein